MDRTVSKRRNSPIGRREHKDEMLHQRLSLIKERHQRLIVRPRDGLLRGFVENDGFDEIEEAEEELQVLEGYGF